MNCAWQELLTVLPPGIAKEVDRIGKDNAQEIRLRLNIHTELVCTDGSHWLNTQAKQEDLDFCINVASRYSPWSAQTIGQGYITAPGGHRIGICGEAVMKNGSMTGIRKPTSLCIRIARDFPDIARAASQLNGSILIIGPPGSGKTTLLRDLIRQISQHAQVCVVDERQELFPDHIRGGKRVDVLRNCPKPEGIDSVLRTMGPDCIAIDEITAAKDCQALLHAGWCGVRLLATAHAGSITDLKSRPLYYPLVETHLFDHILIMDRDKSWREGRIYG